MEEERLIAQKQILTDRQTVVQLAYFLYETPVLFDEVFYGITIRQCSQTGTRLSSSLVSQNKEETLGLVALFARNDVFPCSLEDLMEDYRHSGKV